MTKRALIVDDSRSARVILGRMLEVYGLAVDSAPSAEQALEQLRHSQPDVIFMDHLMPGMDGFQAVQALKSNPQTATIPVIMYTSQEGEQYLEQARALGAVGVLPKTIKQADVSRVLYQLRLLPERREIKQVANGEAQSLPAEVPLRVPPARPALNDLESVVRASLDPLFKEHTSQLRRFVLASLESFARRISGEVKPAMQVAAPGPNAPPMTPPAPQGGAPLRPGPILAVAVAIALLPVAVLAVLQTRTSGLIKQLVESNGHLAALLEGQQAQLAALQQQAPRPQLPAPASITPAHVVHARTEPVPYGEPPLAGSRLERLRELLAELKTTGFRGKIKLVTYVGDFCLVGSSIEGYSLANDELPHKRCDIVGNPYDDGLSAAQRQSLAFANLVSPMRAGSGTAVTVEVLHEGRRPLVAYPTEPHGKLTAGEWNKIAAQNNRVEFLLQRVVP